MEQLYELVMLKILQRLVFRKLLKKLMPWSVKRQAKK